MQYARSRFQFQPTTPTAQDCPVDFYYDPKTGACVRVRTTPIVTPPLHLPPVEVDYEYTPPVSPTPTQQIEEGKAIQWAVSYALAESGYQSYMRQRTGVSQQVYDRLVDRAKYIADEMIRQNTFSPRL